MHERLRVTLAQGRVSHCLVSADAPIEAGLDALRWLATAHRGSLGELQAFRDDVELFTAQYRAVLGTTPTGELDDVLTLRHALVSDRIDQLPRRGGQKKKYPDLLKRYDEYCAKHENVAQGPATRAVARAFVLEDVREHRWSSMTPEEQDRRVEPVRVDLVRYLRRRRQRERAVHRK